MGIVGVDMAGDPKRRGRSHPPERSGGRGTEAERGLRGLVGAGPSQVGVSGAMRARDAARPTAADDAAAQDKVRLVRRNYKPPPPAESSRADPPPGSSGSTLDRS